MINISKTCGIMYGILYLATSPEDLLYITIACTILPCICYYSGLYKSQDIYTLLKRGLSKDVDKG